MILSGVLQGVPDPQARVALADGTATYPALSWMSDEKSGLYRIGTNNIGLSVAGTKVFDVSATATTINGQLVIAGNTATGTTVDSSASRTLTSSVSTAIGLAAGGSQTFDSTVATTTNMGVQALAQLTTANSGGTATCYGGYFRGLILAQNVSSQTCYGGYFEASNSFGAQGTYYGLYSKVTASFATINNGYGLYITSLNTSGTFTVMTGISIAAGSLNGSTNWGFQIDDYNSTHKGPLTLGNTTAGTWLLHVKGGNAARSGVGIDVSTTGPTVPGSSASGVISIYKGATNWYFLITFNDAGTTRYKYLQLNAIGVTWVNNTVLPT